MSTYIESVTQSLLKQISDLAKKANKQKGYKFMQTKQIFDYLPIGYDYTYNISFQIARFQVSDNSYGLVLTNLDPMLFPVEKYTLPIRPNRKSIRKVKVQSSVSFIYRVA
ncbi:MAG: hypothetical protein ACLT5F_07150 [Anaerotignaceae bacterium]